MSASGRIIWMLGFCSLAIRRNCCTARCCSIWYRLFIATLSFFLAEKTHPRPIMAGGVRVAIFYELPGILPDGQALPQAQVTVHNVTESSDLTIISGNDGAFLVPSLNPGQYQVSAK